MAGAESQVTGADAQPRGSCGFEAVAALGGGRGTLEPGVSGVCGSWAKSGVSAEVEVHMEEVWAPLRLTVIKIRHCKPGLSFIATRTPPSLLV